MTSRGGYASALHVTVRLMWGAGMRCCSIVALDIPDYDSQDLSLGVHHRLEEGTPEEQRASQRDIALADQTYDEREERLEDQRPEVMDGADRQNLIGIQ